MAKVNFNNLDDENISGGNYQNNEVNFFTLRNDQDEAVVRFMCDSTDDFEILTVHDVQIGQRYRKVNCIRDPREPLDNCPLCKTGAKISQRFFIKMIQYNRVTDPTTGVITVVPSPVIWERSTAYAKTLKSYLDNYGPLSDVICKIIRHGKAGDMQTTYEIVPNLNKQIYRDEVYVKDTTLFGNFEAFGTIVMDRNFQEISEFVTTGAFPQRQSASSNNTSAPVASPAPSAASYDSATRVTPNGVPAYEVITPQVQPQSAPVVSTQPIPQAAPVVTPRPWDNPTQPAAGGFERPRRY